MRNLVAKSLLFLILVSCAPPSHAQPHGLYVRDKVLLHSGKPYHGIGANYFSLFSRMLKDGDDRSSLDNLKKLSQAGIPFVRFMCGGFWPVEQKLYLENKAEYFRRLDRVVKTAEENHIGLIPSLFWHTSTVSDLVGEPLDQLGNPNSKSIAFIKTYTADVVTRYKKSPAIWAWEFGNEYNLGTDLPNAKEHRPPVWPQLGTATSRSERDEMKWPWLKTAIMAFAQTARRIDRDRILETGHAAPRPSAWHNTAEKSWQADSELQFGEILARDNPDPVDVISVHLYPDEKNGYSGGATSIDSAIEAAQNWAQQIGKPLFIGEFGAERKTGAEKARATFQEFLAAIEKHRVPLATFWVFDLDSQKDDWNISFDNDRADFITMAAQANARLQATAK